MEILGVLGIGLLGLGMLGIGVGFVGMVIDSDTIPLLMPMGIAMTIMGFVLIIPAAISDEMSQKKKFMMDCQKDRKEYECTAMWRAGEAKATAVPMPIIVQGR